MSESLARDLLDFVGIVPLLPLIGATVLLLFGKRIGEPRAGYLATGLMGAAFVWSLVMFAALNAKALARWSAPPAVIERSAFRTRKPGMSSGTGNRTVVPERRTRAGPGFSRGLSPGGAYSRATEVQYLKHLDALRALDHLRRQQAARSRVPGAAPDLSRPPPYPIDVVDGLWEQVRTKEQEIGQLRVRLLHLRLDERVPRLPHHRLAAALGDVVI